MPVKIPVNPPAQEALTARYISHIYPLMKLAQIISSWLRALACLGVIVALMSFPSTASHAATGMHETVQITAQCDGAASPHHAMTGHAEMDHSNMAQVDMVDDAVAGECAPASQKNAKDHTADKCCNGICISAVLETTLQAGAKPEARDKYMLLHAQTRSIELGSFLRPPQYLI